MYYLLSVLLGLIPEVLYFTLFFSYAKNLKGKKIRLFLLIGIAYFCCMLIYQYELFYYILFLALIYIILKLLYKNKTQIVDIFLINLSFCYIGFISYFCFLFLKEDLSNYYTLYVFDRILLFTPFIFSNKFNYLYKKYYNLWNRNYDKKQPIKSITLRNLSLIALNLFIFICYMVCLYKLK